MQHSKALELTDLLLEIQRLMTTLNPLIEEGREEFTEFGRSLKKIIDEIFPTYTVAIVGPVGCGKSTVLSNLLKEAGRHPIASISPSNETFAPMTLGYGPEACLVVRYFSINILNQIENYLKSMEKQGDQAHLVAQYRDLRNRLRKVEAVLAGHENREVVKRINLEGLHRADLVATLKNHIAHSSGNPDVYGIYKVELTYPGEIVEELRNVRFIDLYGFGEPSPLINIKYSRFVSEEDIDVVIYIFPDRSVTEDFNRLFEIKSFFEDIVAKGRLLLVLNKADAYTDVNVGQWPNVIGEFRKTIARHSPILRKYVKDIPVFVLSAASIASRIRHSKEKQIREQSLRNLQRLRYELKDLSTELRYTSSDPSIYLGALFDLLGSLDVLAKGAEMNLERLEDRIPVISRIVDEISQRQDEFKSQDVDRLDSFRSLLENELLTQVEKIDYDRVLSLDFTGVPLGQPQKLFRWMIDTAQNCAQSIFLRYLSGRIFDAIGHFVDQQILHAYQEYVLRQDEAIITEMENLSGGSKTPIQPLWTTVEHSARDFMFLSKNSKIHLGSRNMFERFANWYFRHQCTWDANRGREISAVKPEIFRNLKSTVDVFLRVYIYEDQSLTQSLLSHICVGGERTFWNFVTRHIEKLDELLANQVHISKWKFGLYQNKKFFISHRPEYQDAITELLSKKESAEKRIVELV